ncbi:MAG TPA: hypothetical protein DEP20_01860 [Fusobacteria bacterium]|nr:hypothetical protein [Fusobacteriota bacterium]|tara:strand:+ start:4057 stop:4245 length:189 start_codon:yes stop_codon:yes gene_type:complete
MSKSSKKKVDLKKVSGGMLIWPHNDKEQYSIKVDKDGMQQDEYEENTEKAQDNNDAWVSGVF